jgi:hypothetical protein
MKSWIESAIIAAVVSGIVSGGISVVGADIVDSRSKARQAKIEQALRFSNSDDELIVSSGKYMKEVITAGNLAAGSESLRTEIGRQIRRAEDLKGIFRAAEVDAAIGAYQNALSDYADTLKDANSAIKMRTWAERLGDVTDKRRELTSKLMKLTNISS